VTSLAVDWRGFGGGVGRVVGGGGPCRLYTMPRTGGWSLPAVWRACPALRRRQATPADAARAWGALPTRLGCRCGGLRAAAAVLRGFGPEEPHFGLSAANLVPTAAARPPPPSSQGFSDAWAQGTVISAGKDGCFVEYSKFVDANGKSLREKVRCDVWLAQCQISLYSLSWALRSTMSALLHPRSRTSACATCPSFQPRSTCALGCGWRAT